MPFGTQLTDHGTVRFQLWAPAAKRVALQLESSSGQIGEFDMHAEAQGWFRAEIDHARPGMSYRYRIDGSLLVPDPASRYQPYDVHGPSEIIDPKAWQWRDEGWHGRPWEETVFYELHVGAFSEAGNFAGVEERLDYLADLGITAVELMPVADFPGRRDWGYNGVFPFAPDSRYGRPEDLKALVEAAHRRGLMVFLDVVYNHFGPEGNYLSHYAPAFFTEHHHSPWGAAINFDGADSEWVRRFFMHNALYWLEEYHMDGLRLDAVHAIYDDSAPDFLEELAQAVHDGPAKHRHIHLVLENDNNAAHYLRRDETGSPAAYTAQWNDDLHHASHVIATGECDSYYRDYVPHPVRHLGRCLAEGFAYQGEPSPYRDNRPRGEPSAALPPAAFVSFIQNHDQIGNRPLGERLTELSSQPMMNVLTAILILAPPPPLLFMGQEWGTAQPFPFFCDLGEDLVDPVRAGRRRELAETLRIDPEQLTMLDPFAGTSFERAKLRWSDLDLPLHAGYWNDHRRLLALRQREIVPRLKNGCGGAGYRAFGESAVAAWWRLGDGARLLLYANFGTAPIGDLPLPEARLLFATPGECEDGLLKGTLPPLTAAWFLRENGRRDD
ncbi:MAG: malto-oligosyltrehalose trehalohydrolase [Gammaproteobacteria bacterium]